jgi:hypothetical protein
MSDSTTRFTSISALCALAALASTGCVAGSTESGDEATSEAAQAEIEPIRDYTIYTLTQGGVQIGKLMVTATTGGGYLASREYWYLTQNVAAGSTLVFTSGAQQLWSTPPSGLGTLSFTTADRPSWVSNTPSGTMLLETNPLTGERVGIDWHMTVSGGTWSGYINWWHSDTGYIFGPSQTNTLTSGTPAVGTWYKFQTTPL